MGWEDSFQPVATEPSSQGWESSFVPMAASALSQNIEPVQKEVSTEKPEAPLAVAVNAPFSGLENAAVSSALGGTQAIAGALNKAGILPDTLNIGGSDYGYKAGNAGISEMQRIINEQNEEAMQGNPVAKAGYGGGNLLGNAGIFALTAGENPGYMASLLAGGGTGAMQVTDDQQQRLNNMGFGAAGGVAGKAIGNIFSPQVTDATKQAAMQTAEDFGIPVYRSQVSNSPITKAIASFEKDVPLSGASGKMDDQVKAFNSAVLGTIGQTGDAVTPEALRTADEQIGNVYKTMTSKYDLPSTPQFEDELLKLNDAASSLGDQGKEYALKNQVDHVMSKIKNGVIDGQTYQGIRSQIGRLMRGPNGSPELGQLQNLLDNQFQGSMNQADSLVFQQARGQYRNMLALEKVVANSPNEAISPAKLQGAVKNVFGDYAYGGGSSLERLARLGSLLKDSFPNSGTATRNQLYEFAKHIAGPAVGVGLGGAEGYREGGTGGALMGMGAAAGLNRFGLTPFLYSKMSANPGLMRGLLPALGASAPFSLAPPANNQR